MKLAFHEVFEEEEEELLPPGKGPAGRVDFLAPVVICEVEERPPGRVGQILLPGSVNRVNVILRQIEATDDAPSD
jgi:hypothetical protein